MSPSEQNNVPLAEDSQRQVPSFIPTDLLSKLQLHRIDSSSKFNSFPIVHSPVGSDNSTISSSSSKRSSKFFGSPFSSNDKKYSLDHLPLEEINALVKKFDSILPKVERRQRFASQCGKSEKDRLDMLKHYMSGNKEQPFFLNTCEDFVIRKHVCKAGKDQASKREWRNLYAVLEGNKLSFYKDRNYRQQNWRYHNEKPVKLDENTLIFETSSKKRPYLIRIVLGDGSEYMLQCRNITDWAQWLAELTVTVRRQASRSNPGTPNSFSSLPSTPRKTTASMPTTPKSPFVLLSIKHSSAPNTPSVAKSNEPNQQNMTILLTGVVEHPDGQTEVIGSIVDGNNLANGVTPEQNVSIVPQTNNDEVI